MKKLFITFLPLFLFGCAYYNTFFNAEENYASGLKKLENNTAEKIPADVKTHFDNSIAKSWKVIDLYGDSSRWADDALLLIGKSYYHLEEFDKSQEVLEKFLQKYIKSELFSEAELWYAQTMQRRGEYDMAIQSFSRLTSEKDEEEIRTLAYKNLGDVYYALEDYEEAIDNFLKCIEIDSGSETEGMAYFNLAESYYQIGKNDEAISSYENVLKYDLPIARQYDAVIQIANALLRLNRNDEAKNMLHTTLRDQRFKKQYSMIATKLANIIEEENDLEFAIIKYKEVIQKYPRAEGAALASFYIAQIYEFEYGWMDSAKVKYDKVKSHFAASESVEEANKRSAILREYLKIKKQLVKDRDDLFRLVHGDSALVDSQETNEAELIADDKENVQINDIEGVGEALRGKDKSKINKKKAKVAVSRKPEVVKKSLLKNSYNLAEYFLLNYQHYDSAKVSYHAFIDEFTDSLLTPKAYYSLYYIYKDIESDSVMADSFQNIIIKGYPDTPYGKKLSGAELEEQKNSVDMNRVKYREAELLKDNSSYTEAIRLYTEIAKQDSGSVWAIKSRYATAYIYEHLLLDVKNALESYAVLAKEYPKTKEGKIAKKKITQPPKPQESPQKETEKPVKRVKPDDKGEKIEAEES